MTEIKHSKYCEAQQAAREAWIARWPDHCPTCEGAGGKYIQATRWEPDDFDICSCLENGHCPRCMSKVEYSARTGVSVCPVCNWTDSNFVDGDPMPVDFVCPQVDCDCLEDNIREDMHLESDYEMRQGEGFEDFDFNID